jgi:hypothetical protein
MADKIDMHLIMGLPQARWVEKLMRKMGLSKAAVMRTALYDLAVKEGIVPESPRETARDAARNAARESDRSIGRQD